MCQALQAQDKRGSHYSLGWTIVEGPDWLSFLVALWGFHGYLSLIGGSLSFDSSLLLLLQPTSHHQIMVGAFLVNVANKGLSKTALRSRHHEHEFPLVALVKELVISI